MAKLKLKLDTQRIKDFLLQRGEMLGLAVAGVVLLVFLGIALLIILGSSSRVPEVEDATKKLQAQINGAAITDTGSEVAKLPDWKKLENPHQFVGPPWFQPGQVGDSKRRNPLVLAAGRPLSDGEKALQVDVVRGPVLVYELNYDDRTVYAATRSAAGGAAAEQQHYLVPLAYAKRMVVVSATFPYQEQLELFRKALHVDKVEDLFTAADTTPHFLGLHVIRCEVLPNGKATPWEALYTFEPKDGKALVKSKSVDALLRAALYDRENPKELAEYIFTGLVTPLPELAPGGGRYPPLQLTGLTSKGTTPVATGPKGGMPPVNPNPALPGVGPGPALPGVTPKGGDPGVLPKAGPVGLKNLSAALQKEMTPRFSGDIYPFHPFGISPKDEEKEKKGAGPNGPPGVQSSGTTNNFAPSAARTPERCLARFVDVDVQPGKTYVYGLQVRMANPNYEKPHEVAFKTLADNKELVPSEWTYTPPVTLEHEWQYYVVDQMQLDPTFVKRFPRGVEAADVRPADKDRAAVQLQEWVETALDQTLTQRTVAAWVVADRLLLYRGEYVGRERLDVEVPEWNQFHQVFEVTGGPFRPKTIDKKQKSPGVDFLPPSAPVVVDFAGGRKEYRVGSTSVPDEGPLEMLFLSPDGKLSVRDSRTDTDPEGPDSKLRISRREGEDSWRRRLSSLWFPNAGNPDNKQGGAPRLPGT